LAIVLFGCRVPSPSATSPSLAAEPSRATPSSAPPPLTDQDLALPSDLDAPSPSHVGEEGIAADMQLLLYALRRGYAGFSHVGRAMTRLEQRLVELPKAYAGQTTKALCDAIGDAFWLIPDAHLTARLPDYRCGTKWHQAARIPALGSNLVSPDADKPWLMEQRTVADKRIVILAIRSFPLSEDPRWDGFSEATAATTAADGVVVDLRHNGGGDDQRGYELANRLAGTQLPPGGSRTYERRTPENARLLLNGFLEFAMGTGNPSAFGGRMAEQAALVERLRNNPGAPEAVEDYGRAVVDPAKAFNGPIVILVDAGCGSSCESTMNALRMHPRARVVGERTAGYVHFGDVGVVVLPHSRIRTKIPTKYTEYEGGVNYDKVGMPVDVALPPGTDGLQAALACAAGTCK
jgi:hypothetical protein